MAPTGTIGMGTTPRLPAKNRQTHLPRAIPSGTPITAAMAVMDVVCQITVSAFWRRLNPMEERMPVSLDRLTLLTTRTWTSVASANTTMMRLRTRGKFTAPPKLTRLAGVIGNCTDEAYFLAGLARETHSCYWSCS